MAALDQKENARARPCVRGRSFRRALTRASLAFIAVAALALFSPQARAQNPTEYEVKAAFLYNFAKFVEWPASAGSINLCVVGGDPFGTALDDIVRNKTIRGLPVKVLRLRTEEKAVACSIAFINAIHEGLERSILASLQSASTLTVGESPHFTLNGGAVRFFLEHDRVRFEINIDAVERAHLKISAQLLSLAKIRAG
jgi:hypothetical protein